MQRKLVLGFCSIILFLSLIPIAVSQEPPSLWGDVSFQPNVIPNMDIYYEDYSFVFELKNYFIRIRPFVIYNNQYYGMKQIVQWIKNNYPNVNYKWLIEKSVKAIHYGFNLTKLPQTVADKIDYLGFRLVDLNFPLSWFELEEIEVFDIETEPYNITRIHIPKAHLTFSFEDLYPQGFSVEHVNSTYILIGNVKGKTDLIVDPITFSSNTITAIGGTEGVPLDFEDLYQSDKAGEFVLHDRDGITAIDPTAVAVPNALRPTDLKELGVGNDAYNLDLFVRIENWNKMWDAEILIFGADRFGISRSYNLTVDGNGDFNIDQMFASILNTRVVDFNVNPPNGNSFDYELIQGQWGVVWQIDDVETQYQFDAKLIFGNGTVAGTTWFADTSKQIVFIDGLIVVGGLDLIRVKNHASFVLGNLIDATNHLTDQGCDVLDFNSAFAHYIVRRDSGSTVEFFDGSFTATDREARVQLHQKIYNVQCRGQAFLYGDDFDVFNYLVTGETVANYGLMTHGSAPTSAERLTLLNVRIGIRLEYGTTITDVIARNVRKYLVEPFPNRTSYLVNWDSDAWTFSWTYGSANIYRQYEFDLTVTFPNGTAIQNANVTVTHYGQGESQDFTELTDASGQIAQKTLTMGFYNQTGGNTIYSYNPHNINITYSGMQTYTKNFTLAEQTEWIIALTEETANGNGSAFNATYYLLGSISAIPLMLLFAVLIIRRKQNGNQL